MKKEVSEYCTDIIYPSQSNFITNEKSPLPTGYKNKYLTVVRFDHIKRFFYPNAKKQIRYKYFYLCRCSCGKEFITDKQAIVHEHTKSCGCYSKSDEFKQILRDKNTTHGLTGTRIYKIWRGMKDRCNNPNDQHYKWWGERGIKVCEEWENSFETFYQWALDNGYKGNLTIERIDVNKGYNPDNCTWISNSKQQENRTNAVRLTLNGETHSFKEWAKITGICESTLRHRKYIYRWSDRKTLTTSVNPPNRCEIEYKGKIYNQSMLAKEMNIDPKRVQYYCKKYTGNELIEKLEKYREWKHKC